MSGGKWGSFKPIECGKATVGIVKLRRWFKKKEVLSHYNLFIASILVTSQMNLQLENQDSLLL